VGSVTSFWESMGLVAAAGLVVALSQVVGGWTKGGHLRLSPMTFLLGFVPVLVCAGWILMATQPGNGWHEGTVASWSRSAGIFGLVHALGLWHGVLAFGLGLTLGLTLDTVPARAVEPVAETRRDRVRRVPADDGYDTYDDDYDDEETAVAGRRRSFWGRRRAPQRDADEPLQGERDAGYESDRLRSQREAADTAQPRMASVGPTRRQPPEDDAEG
jgi:hypothetical protein